VRIGIPDRFVEHGKRELLLEDVGLTPEAIAARAVRALAPRGRRLVAEG
jgi:1-deoxy-D-xylulose-5-phosphate synthase